MVSVKIVIPLRAVTKTNSYLISGGRMRRPERHKHFETTCRLYALKQYSGRPMTGELLVRINFSFNNNKMPDLWNLPKSVGDALNGVVWKDDRQVMETVMSKRNNGQNLIEIYVEERS